MLIQMFVLRYMLQQVGRATKSNRIVWTILPCVPDWLWSTKNIRSTAISSC